MLGLIVILIGAGLLFLFLGIMVAALGVALKILLPVLGIAIIFGVVLAFMD